MPFYEKQTNTLILRPLVPLHERTTYAVVVTRRLKDALALLDIRLLDHFVIGDGRPVSMASRGLL